MQHQPSPPTPTHSLQATNLQTMDPQLRSSFYAADRHKAMQLIKSMVLRKEGPGKGITVVAPRSLHPAYYRQGYRGHLIDQKTLLLTEPAEAETVPVLIVLDHPNLNEKWFEWMKKALAVYVGCHWLVYIDERLKTKNLQGAVELHAVLTDVFGFNHTNVNFEAGEFETA